MATFYTVKLTTLCGDLISMTTRQIKSRLQDVAEGRQKLMYGGDTLFLSVKGKDTYIAEDGVLRSVSEGDEAYGKRYLVGFDVGALEQYPDICTLVAFVYLSNKDKEALMYADARMVLGDRIRG